MNEEDPLVGWQIGNYIVDERIGHGAMGVVYRARHITLTRNVAIKFLSSHLASDPNYVERFFREARAAAHLNHPNLIAVYDAGVTSEVYYIVMEYVEGSDLSRLLKKRGMFGEEELAPFSLKVADALNYAHRNGVIHRDIKPENLILTPQNDIKVADLGLAKQIYDQSASMTMSDVVVGTPFYASPEQIRGLKSIDARADIYSMGTTLFHLATGRVPFDGNSPAEVMSKHLTELCPLAKTVNPKLSDEFSQILARMMAKDPNKRYQNMGEVFVTFEKTINRYASTLPDITKTQISPSIPPRTTSAGDTLVISPRSQEEIISSLQKDAPKLKVNDVEKRDIQQDVAPPFSRKQRSSFAVQKIVLVTSVVIAISFAIYFFSRMKSVFVEGISPVSLKGLGSNTVTHTIANPLTNTIVVEPPITVKPVVVEPIVQPVRPTSTKARKPIVIPDIKSGTKYYPSGITEEDGLLKRLPSGRWVKHGIWTNYWANGKISTFGEYQEGQKVGIWPFWVDDGRLVLTNSYPNNSK